VRNYYVEIIFDDSFMTQTQNQTSMLDGILVLLILL